MKSKTIAAAATKGVNVSNKFSTVSKVTDTAEKRLRVRCKIGYNILGFCFLYQTNTVFFNLDWKRKEVRGWLVVVERELVLCFCEERRRQGHFGYFMNQQPFIPINIGHVS